MSKHIRGGVLLAVLGLISVVFSTTPAAAQFFSRGCQNCQRPVTHCNCQSHRPVTETQMVPQQVTTYRDEVITQYRQEAITQSVPVTTYRDVIVDEGSYQTVYVPKQVTKRIPQVSYQQQVAYRSVPYQITRRVPQISTQMVAQQQVRYQPYSFQTTHVAPISQPSLPVYGGCAPAVAPIAVAPCGPCGAMTYAPLPTYQSYAPIGQPVIAAPAVVNPVTMLAPTTSSNSFASDADIRSNPVPDPKFLDSPGAARDSWSTVGSKAGKSSGSVNSVADHSGDTSIRFKPARTVYRSWESQSRFAAGDGPERR